MNIKTFNKFSCVIICIVALTISIICALSSCAKTPEEPKSFAFDSWETLSKVAEGGLDNLLETYKPIGGTFIIQNLDDENERRAKTREINIEGLDNYKVRVIGENHDTCENGKVAPLTFEFSKVVNNIPYAKPKEISNVWKDSELRNFLNNKLIDMLPQDLKSSIKAVKKDTCIGGGFENVESTIEKIFPLSVTEINVSGINKITEGSPYKLYLDHPYLPGSENDPRNKNDKHYWLRSPMYQNSLNIYVMRVNKNEGFDNQIVFDDCCESIGVIPCFCI